jgi:hypothetical protein
METSANLIREDKEKCKKPESPLLYSNCKRKANGIKCGEIVVISKPGGDPV